MADLAGVAAACDSGVADRLTVEISETAAMADLEAMHVSSDDEGLWHEGRDRRFRRRAHVLPGATRTRVDMVKIDGAFIQNMTRSSDDRFFVRTLIDVGATSRDGDRGRMGAGRRDGAVSSPQWGCRYLQGMYLGRANTQAVVAGRAQGGDRLTRRLSYPFVSVIRSRRLFISASSFLRSSMSSSLGLAAACPSAIGPRSG